MCKSENRQAMDRILQGPADNTKSELEKRADRLEDKALSISDNPYTNIVHDPIAAGFSAIKHQVSNFAENCHVLLPILDTLSKAHPAISIAVSVVKVGVELELTRRENDGRVLALYATMLEMMEALRALESIVPAEADKLEAKCHLIESRLEKRFGGPEGVLSCVEACLRTCDSYYKCRLPVRILTSGKWQHKFTALAAQFEKHKTGLQIDLQIHAAVSLASVDAGLAAVTTTMQLIFDRLCSTEEQDLAAFVRAHGGQDAVAQDDALLARLLDMCSNRGAAPDVRELQKQVAKDVERVISEDFRAFESKFQLMKERIEDRVDGVVHRETDRVIKALEASRAGPHERILDRDVYHVWTENQWRGSAKASRLVLALHDHFSHLMRSNNASIPRSLDDSAGTNHGLATSSASRDLWALQYINVFRVHQLIEAIDDDVSSFVTVDEVNAFTSARPLGWSLPHWIAYSTVGTELAVNWYYRRIIRLLLQLDIDVQKALAANRTMLNAFMGCTGLRFIEALLSGLRDPNILDDVEWDYNLLFKRFKSYVVRREATIQSALQSASYLLGDHSTLELLMGSRQPENYIFPLIFLLLRRAVSVIQSAHDTVLNEEELHVIDTSLFTVQQAVHHRISALQVAYRLQNLDPKGQIRQFFYGIYSNVNDASPVGDFWTRNARELYFEEDSAYYRRSSPTDSSTLFYGPEIEDVDFFPSAVEVGAQLAAADRRSLVGRWSGGYAYGLLSDASVDSSGSLDIDFHATDGWFVGHGRDAVGAFAVRGRFERDRVVLRKSYASHGWSYEGTLSSTGDAIAGTWGGSGQGGRFWMKRQVAEDVLEHLASRSGQPARIPYLLTGSADNSSLAGHWWGGYTYGFAIDAPTEDPVSFDIYAQLPGGTVVGGGLDAVGPFTIEGRVGGDQKIALRKAYASHAWNYTGLVSGDRDEIAGSWGDSECGGKFHLHRRPADYLLFRPAELDNAREPVRACLLWQWSIQTVIYRWWVKHQQSQYIWRRREYRERYTELVLRKDAVGSLYGSI